MRMSTKRRWLDVRTIVDVGSERSPSGSHWMKARADIFGGIAVAGCVSAIERKVKACVGSSLLMV